MDRTIIVSDLHIDTWTNNAVRGTKKCKKDHFFDLLDWCDRVRIRELVINGDLMDFPPYEGQNSFAERVSIAREVIDRLVMFSFRTPITYVFGNHDIGISGFRCMAELNIAPLHHVNLCYPDYSITEYPDSDILIEHGHLDDPSVGLYRRDLLNRTYSKEELQRFYWKMQRRARIASPPGQLDPLNAQFGGNYYQTVVDYLEKEKGKRKRLFDALWEWLTGKSAKTRMDMWWDCARARMDDYVDCVRRENDKLKGTIYQIYGHTHRADVRVGANETLQIIYYYINTGTWAENADTAPYLVVDEHGKVWLHDWINDAPELKWL